MLVSTITNPKYLLIIYSAMRTTSKILIVASANLVILPFSELADHSYLFGFVAHLGGEYVSGDP